MGLTNLQIGLWNVLGGRLGMGKVFHLVTSKSGSDIFYARLLAAGVDDGDIFATLATAYAAMTTGQGDTLYVYPGDHVQTSMTTWAKDDTFVIGTCANVEGDYTQGGCNIYTVTATVVHTLYVTGARCYFENLKISNGGASAACLGALLLAGYGSVFRNCNLMGILDAAQIASANPYSVGIAYGGYFPLFDRCIIGTCTWGPRTQTLSGHLKFTGAGPGVYPPDGGIFRRCRFLSWAETAALAAVYLPSTQCIDRMWLFDECTFYNFWTNVPTLLTYVIDDNCNYTHNIVLKRCTAVGYDQWQTDDRAIKCVQADMPIVGLGGGLAIQPTNSTGS